MITSLFTLFTLFTLSESVSANSPFLFPDHNSRLTPGENYNIGWSNNNNSNVHLQLELNKNNEWKSSYNQDHHFLSLMVDKSKTNLTWHVPLLFSDYSHYVSRMKLTHVDVNHTSYSDNFSFLEITESPTLSPTNMSVIISNSDKDSVENFDFVSWWMIAIYCVVGLILAFIFWCVKDGMCCGFCYKKNNNNGD